MTTWTTLDHGVNNHRPPPVTHKWRPKWNCLASGEAPDGEAGTHLVAERSTLLPTWPTAARDADPLRWWRRYDGRDEQGRWRPWSPTMHEAAKATKPRNRVTAANKRPDASFRGSARLDVIQQLACRSRKTVPSGMPAPGWDHIQRNMPPPARRFWRSPPSSP